ncbi:MAG: hypothetical protein ACOYT8_04710 [Candidatus Dependentiae bacterium]
MSAPNSDSLISEKLFRGNIFIFQAFDVGDDINLEKLKLSGDIIPKIVLLSKYFKNYHTPLAIELPEQQKYISAKIHNFGAISLTYKIPFYDTLDNIRKNLEALDNEYELQGIIDAEVIFKKSKKYITKSNFFHTRSSYVVIQLYPDPKLDTVTLKDNYGSVIASTLRFETQTLSEYQKNEILASAFGYFRGDLIVIDTEAACIYDDEYEETLDFFEFANIQHLELRYFDRVLDQQLNNFYEGKVRKVPISGYLPVLGTLAKGPIDELSKLKVDISVITERLEGSIKIAGEPFYSELYALLIEKRDLKNLKESIDKKLGILNDVLSVLQQKIDAIREDMLTVSIILLIFLELIIALFR